MEEINYHGLEKLEVYFENREMLLTTARKRLRGKIHPVQVDTAFWLSQRRVSEKHFEKKASQKF